MRRIYADTSHFRAPFAYKSLMLQGLGEAAWPPGRHYYDVSQFMQPFANGYFQDNTLRGLGADTPTVPVVNQASGVPTWAWLGGAFLAGVLAGRIF